MLTQYDVKLAVDDLLKKASMPKRKGGLGPIQRQYATRERLTNAVMAADEATSVLYAGVDLKERRAEVEKAAVERALVRESAGLITLLLPAFLPLIRLVIEWAIQNWLNKKLS